MAKPKSCLLVSVFVCTALFVCGALNYAFADESTDGLNSWRFFHGEFVLSDSGASTDNLDTFEEAAADSADGVMACSVEANGSGWPVYNWFDQFNRGYCSGVGAYKGVDVSEWQGKINWAQVKTAGVDFAILRCGYASTYPDKQWHNNVQGCLSSGMPFGVYLYSRATSPEEASKEADFVISQLKSEGLTGADLALPVYFDMEDSKMVGKNYAAIAQAFFDKLTAAGYPVGTYANLSWWNTRLTSPVFDKYSKWVAAYNASIGLTYAPMSNFSEGNGVWQFSDYGSIPGISGRVDLNYTYMAPVNSDHWIKSESKWWYRYVDGSYPANCWAQIDGQWYHFDASGWMQTGWLWVNGAWYYLGPSGAMLVGWLNDGGVWYYLDPEAGGAMATGVKTVQGAAYFFDASGAMAAGWCVDGGVWRYAAPSGALVSGWNVVNGSWYWFDGETYAMREGWLNDGGFWYWLADGGDGRMATGWQQIGGSWYWLSDSGAMATGWCQIDGVYYFFNGSGAMEHDCWVGDYYLTSSGAMATDTWVGGYHVDADGKWDNR
ncbi:GH25 family lysozyme [Slackia isoflavoniconvertens]|uniref:GH25 family lysozyme n=1 Tax=Slackia isoflavoniconvertens TaxID=572010 RepID=UPI003AF01B68